VQILPVKHVTNPLGDRQLDADAVRELTEDRRGREPLDGADLGRGLVGRRALGDQLAGTAVAPLAAPAGDHQVAHSGEPRERLGAAAAGLVPVMVLVGFQTTVAMARRGFELSGDVDVGGDALRAAVVNFGSLLDFAILVSAALLYRRRPHVHKRLMLFAALAGITPTPVAHLIGHWVGPQPWADALFPLSALFFVSLIAVHEWLTEHRVHPVTMWLGIAVVTMERVVTLGVQRTEGWRSFAQWLVE